MSAEWPILYARDLPDGRRVEVIPLTFGRARICIGRAADDAYEDGW